MFRAPFLAPSSCCGGEQCCPEKGCSRHSDTLPNPNAVSQNRWRVTHVPKPPTCRLWLMAPSVSSPATSPRTYRRRALRMMQDMRWSMKSWVARWFGLKWGRDCAKSSTSLSPRVSEWSSRKGRTNTTGADIVAGVAGRMLQCSIKPPRGLRSLICVRFTPLAFHTDEYARKAAEVWNQSFPSPRSPTV